MPARNASAGRGGPHDRQGEAPRARDERTDERILADPNAYLNAAPYPSRGGNAGRGGYGGGRPGKAGQSPQRASGERNGGNRGARHEDAGVRSNLPPGWTGNPTGRR
jgi:hypothetical protein